jgi:hypothetical protein
MAIEFILVRDPDGVVRGVLADKIGAGEEYAQILKLGYGADGALSLLDEKPSTESAQTAANGFLSAVAAALAGTLEVDLPDAQKTPSGALRVGNTKTKLRDEFPTGGLKSALWDLVATGSGMAVSTGNGTTGSYLLISSGTTINAETIVRSKDIFSLPLRLAAFVTASQRIANQEFFVELIEVDAAGAPVVGTSQTNAGTSPNHASVKFDGISATSALMTARSGDAPEFVSAATTITTTAPTGTGPNWFPSGLVELQVSGEHVQLLQAPVDTLAAATAARRITQAAPDPEALYKLQIRARNLGTAPATSTDWRVHAIRLFDYTRLDVNVIGGPGHGAAASAVAVNVAGGTLALSAGTNLAGDIGVQYRANAIGGGTPANVNSPATPAAQSLKAGAGRITSYDLSNVAAQPRYLKVFNTAGAVVLGTTPAAFEIAIPAGQTKTLGPAGGIALTAGIQIAVTGARGLTDATAITLGDVVGHIETV